MTGESLHPATLAAQALGWIDGSTGAVVLLAHTATTFPRDPDNQCRRGRSYGRAAHMAAPQVMHWSLRSWFKNFAEASGINVTFAMPIARRAAPYVQAEPAFCGSRSRRTRWDR